MIESKIIKGCKKGDQRAYKAFVDGYSGYMYTICYRYMGNKEVAKDALQDSLVQVITNINKYTEQGKFKSWIGSVTVKKCLDLLRKEKRHNYASMENVAEPSIREESSLKLEHDDLMVFIENIPEKYRIAINMFLIEGYSHREISEQLNITESSSRSLVSRGRKMIMEAFELEKSRANHIPSYSNSPGRQASLKII